MSDIGTVLIVASDTEEWRPAIDELTQEYGYRALTATSAAGAGMVAEEAHVDVVICDHCVGGDDAIEVLRGFRVAHPTIVRLLVKDADGSAAPTPKEAAVYQFIRRPLDPEQIGLIVKRALETRELARRHRLLSRELKFSSDAPFFLDQAAGKLTGESNNFEKLAYASEAMAELCDLARQAAPTVTEGEDKPLKYPHIFAAADLVVLSKIDLLPHVDFDAERAIANARTVKPGIAALKVSARTGAGLDDWYAWLRQEAARDINGQRS